MLFDKPQSGALSSCMSHALPTSGEGGDEADDDGDFDNDNEGTTRIGICKRGHNTNENAIGAIYGT